jgi:hypothetical protein
METEFLFSSSDWQKLKILKMIMHARQTHKVSRTAMLEKLKISEYKLNSLINELSIDVTNFFAGTDIELSVALKTVTILNLTPERLREISLFYLKESVKFKIFRYIFFEDNVVSRNKFLKDNFISQANFYSTKRSIEDYLSSTGFPSDQLSIIGNHEFLIREKLASFYYLYFDGIENAFPKFEKYSTGFIEFIERKFHIELSPGQQSKLELFLEIQRARMENHCYLYNLRYETDSAKAKTILKAFDNQFNKCVQHKESVGFDSEVNYLFLFLTSQEIVSPSKLPLTSNIDTKIDKLNRHLLNTVNKTNHDKLAKLTTRELDNLTNSIRNCEQSSLIFDITPISLEDTESMKKLTHLFPLGKQISY